MIAAMFSILFPLSIFLFFRSILDDKKKSTLIYFITILLSALGILIIFISDNYFYLSLFVPFIFYCLYRGFLLIFIKRKGRLPLDTFFDMSWGNWSDRIFSIGVLFFGLLIPFLSIMLLVDNIVNEGLFGINDSPQTNLTIADKASVGIAKCTSVDISNVEDFVFYEFFLDGRKVRGTTIIEQGSGEELVNKYFKVRYNSRDKSESVLLVNDEVTDIGLIKAAGFE